MMIFVALFGWAVVVAEVQESAIRTLDPVLLGIFALMGLATWVGILVLVGAIRDRVEAATEPPQLDLDHSSIRARWVGGKRERGLWVLEAVFGVALHGLLLGSAAKSVVVAVSDSPNWMLAIGVSAGWTYTALRWLLALLARLRPPETIELDADLDRVQITRGSGVSELPLQGLEIAVDGQELEFRSTVEVCSVPCAPGPTRDELVSTLQRMAQRSVAPDPVELPDALARLRRREGATE